MRSLKAAELENRIRRDVEGWGEKLSPFLYRRETFGQRGGGVTTQIQKIRKFEVLAQWAGWSSELIESALDEKSTLLSGFWYDPVSIPEMAFLFGGLSPLEVPRTPVLQIMTSLNVHNSLSRGLITPSQFEDQILDELHQHFSPLHTLKSHWPQFFETEKSSLTPFLLEESLLCVSMWDGFVCLQFRLIESEKPLPSLFSLPQWNASS